MPYQPVNLQPYQLANVPYQPATALSTCDGPYQPATPYQPANLKPYQLANVPYQPVKKFGPINKCKISPNPYQPAKNSTCT
jgi:hypothetical protein